LFFRLFLRTVRHHLGFHLLIPLIVTITVWLLFELVRAIWNVHALNWSAINVELLKQITPDLQHLALELISVYSAFFIVVAVSVWQSSDVRWTMVGLLEDTLPGATDYFAIGTIPLREWFEPNTQVYLATIVRHQIERRGQSSSASQNTQFRHERVLLFQTANDMRAVQASYLDEHFAKSFSAIHDRFEIPLGYLEPKDVKEVISKVGARLPKALVKYPWFARPRNVWWNLKLEGVPRLLPFAVIEVGGQSRVLLFRKDGKTLTVDEISKPEDVAVCKDIVGLIRNRVHNASGELKKEFEFSKFLRP
jgi:hypothetical protein